MGVPNRSVVRRFASAALLLGSVFVPGLVMWAMQPLPASAQTPPNYCAADPPAELPAVDAAVPSIEGITITSMTGSGTAVTGRYWVRIEWQPLALEHAPSRCVVGWAIDVSPPLPLGTWSPSETVVIDETRGRGALPGEERCYRLVVISGEARSDFTEGCYTVPLPPATGSAGIAADGRPPSPPLVLAVGLALLLPAGGLAAVATTRRRLR